MPGTRIIGLIHRHRMYAARAVCSLTFAVSATGAAGPLVLEESARIVSPNPSIPIQSLWQFNEAGYASRIGVFGDELIVSGTAPATEPRIAYETWIFKRAADGQWKSAQKLGHVEREEYFDPPMGLAIDSNVAVAGAIFERGANGWTQTAPLKSGIDTEISNGLVLNSVSYSGWAASVTGKTASGWKQLTQLIVPNVYLFDNGEVHGGDVDISGTEAILAAPEGETSAGSGDPTPPTAVIFEGGPTNWKPAATLLGADGKPVAIDKGTALVGGELGTHVFAKAGGAWGPSTVLQSASQFVRGRSRVTKIKDDLIVLGYSEDDLRGSDAGSLSVWQRSASGAFEEVATLVSSDFQYRLGYDLDVQGRRIVATGDGAAYVWDLPQSLTQPSVEQDDFEAGNDARWTRVAGSTWSVANTSNGRVYRQSSLAGDAGAYFGIEAWKNQSIEADITATGFSGSGRWLGIVARRQDAANYYYAALRQSNTLSLRKRVNGSYSTLASKSFPVALNRNYRLRLEAIGTRLRVFVDGTLQLEAIDNSLSAGKTGMQMYRASADYDNVVITPDPQTSLYANDFEGSNDTWTHTGNGKWSVTKDGSKVFRQSDSQMTIGARALTGIATGDQIVEARVKAVAFDSSTNPWFGLITRYVDDNNYYYITVRKDGNVSLRKLVNGAIEILQTKPMTTTLNRWYTLRFESVGSHLRVYVDGKLTLQAHDTSNARGKYGLMTYRTAAHFDNVKVHSP
jgi:hypothetical protein